MPQVCAISEGGAVADEIESYGSQGHCPREEAWLGSLRPPKTPASVTFRKYQNLTSSQPASQQLGVPASILNNGIVTVRTEHNVFYKGRVVWGYPAINSILGFLIKK